MTSETFHLPIAGLRAALQTTGKNDIRFYLCGVLLERRDGGLRLVSTDGETLFAYLVEAGVGAAGDDLEAILPRELLEPLKRPQKNSQTHAVITLSREAEATGPWRIRIEVDGKTTEGAALDGKFPDP